MTITNYYAVTIDRSFRCLCLRCRGVPFQNTLGSTITEKIMRHAESCHYVPVNKGNDRILLPSTYKDQVDALSIEALLNNAAGRLIVFDDDSNDNDVILLDDVSLQKLRLGWFPPPIAISAKPPVIFVPETMYDVNGEKHCLIVSSEAYEGSMIVDFPSTDRNRAADLYRSLGFKVEEIVDKKAEEIRPLMKGYATRTSHEGVKVIAIVMFGHAHVGGFYGVDMESLSIMDILRMFSPESAPLLANAVKLITIDACRVKESEEDPDSAFPDIDIAYPHCLLMFSTQRFTEAKADITGSRFTNMLAKNTAEKCRDTHALAIFDGVQDEMRKTVPDKKGYVQVPDRKRTLTKDLYYFTQMAAVLDSPTLSSSPESIHLSASGGEATVTLANAGSKMAAFKVKTSNANFYQFAPVFGFVDGNGSTTTVTVTRLSGGDPSMDKICVEYGEAPDGEKDAKTAVNSTKLDSKLVIQVVAE